jgi:hypothetical protein
MKAKTLKRKTTTQKDAVQDIFLTTNVGLTLKQVATRATKKSGKETTEKYVMTQLRKLQKPENGDFELIQTPGARKGSADKFELRVKPSHATPTSSNAPNMPTTKPATPATAANPINFGSTPTASTTPPVASTPAAGSRAANSYADSLKGG